MLIFWPTFLHFVDIFAEVKTGPVSHEHPHVDRNKIYFPEFPTREHCPLPCLGRSDETWREEEARGEEPDGEARQQIFGSTAHPVE